MLEVIKRSRELGKRITLTSNGFLGQNRQQAARRIRLLEEYGSISLFLYLALIRSSLSKIHSSERVVNILNGCRDEGLHCHLNMAVSSDQMGNELIEALGDSVIGVPITESPVQRVCA